MARKIVLQTPKGNTTTSTSKNGQVTSKLEWNPNCKPSFEKYVSTTQAYIDKEVLRRCSPLVPFLTGVLEKSGNLHTVIGDGEVRYKTPDARKVYYTSKSKGQRGAKWFERMKAASKDAIKKGAEKYMERRGKL